MEGLGVNGLVVGSDKSKKSYVKQSGGRQWTTMLECVSATGRAIKLLIIFNGKNV